MFDWLGKFYSFIFRDIPEQELTDQVVSLVKQITPYDVAIDEWQNQNTHESTGDKSNPRIILYHSHTTLKAKSDEVPWCSSFVCYCHDVAKYVSTQSASADSWLDLPEADGDEGDLAIFSRIGGHHVAFIRVKYKKGDLTISCLGGNQHDEVCIEPRDVKFLLGFRRSVKLKTKDLL